MEVAVIILNYNSADDCRQCISSLERQEDVSLDIVVVDNCSRVEERQAVETLCHQCGATFIAAEENRGYNAGNNIGLRYAARHGYPYALIANPDMRFDNPRYIATLVDNISSRSDVVVSCSDIVGLDGIHQNPMMGQGHWIHTMGWLPEMLLHRRRKAKDSYSFIDNWQQSHYCSKVSGCCLLVDVGFMKEIGFFDEGVFLYSEESILARQVEAARRRMYYDSTITALHAHRNSTGGNKLRQMRILRDSRIYYYRHHSGYSALGRCISILSERLRHLAFTTAYRLLK